MAALWFGLQLGEHVRQWQDYLLSYGWFLALQVLDLGTTVAVLGQGGGEASPIPLAALEAHGEVSLLGMKLFVLLLTMSCWVPSWTWLLRQPGPVREWAIPSVLALVALANISYSVVVVHNLSNLDSLLDSAG